MEEKEIRLIRQAQRGEVAAFEQLVAHHDRQVIKLAYYLLGNEHDAEDVYQEVFLLVYRKLSSFKFKSSFATWLNRVVVNYCLTYRSRRNRRSFVSLDSPVAAPGDVWEPQVNMSTPESAAISADLRCRIEQALAELSEQQRSVFVLRHFHGHKLREIAEIMSCAEGTVKNYLFRATRQMQKKLRAFNEDLP